MLNQRLCKPQQNKVRNIRWLALGVGSLLLLTGCFQKEALISGEDSSGLVVAEEVVPAVESKEQVIPLKAGDMYQILVAEMMALKGFEAQAFDIIFKLAYKIRSPDLAERAFQLSMKTYDAQKIEVATSLWREISPNVTTPWRASFLIALRQNDVKKALSDWERYRGLSKIPLEQDLLLAAQKVGASSPSEPGLVFMKALVKKYPDTWASYFSMGLVADAFNQFDVALDALEKARARQTEDSESKIHQFLAKLYLQNPPAERGISELEGYLKKYPKDWLVQERMARLEVQASRYDAATVRYNLILNAEPNAYTSRLSLALVQIEQKNFKQAEKNLLKVEDQKGYSDVVNYYLGLINQEMKATDKALSYFERVKLGPYYVDAQLHQAEMHFSKEAPDHAFEILNRIEGKQVRDILKVHRAKAIFYSELSQPERAIEAYNEILALAPNHMGALMNQAMLFYDLKQLDSYVANLKRVIEIDPNEADALNALGYHYAERNENLAEAEVLLQRAYELNPESYYILDSVGWLYFQKGQYALAKTYLQKALDIQMDDEVLIHMIRTHWQLGEREQARALWQKNHKDFLQNETLQGLIKALESTNLESPAN
ncbi:MAG: tetratricopeptide repeat protein [Thiomicrorhabdus sp.]|nr:tetratricopeptide repeat protein [Thiomicrorhabdus sp.]